VRLDRTRVRLAPHKQTQPSRQDTPSGLQQRRKYETQDVLVIGNVDWPDGDGTGGGEANLSLHHHGKEIVAKLNCAMCHALDGKGGKSAKPLNGIAEGKTDEQLMSAMMNPKKAFGEKTMMPCFKSKITDEQVPAVMAYLKSLKKQECK